MKDRRTCSVCGNYLDTLFETAKSNVKTCSNKCRQKRYRDRKRILERDSVQENKDLESHEIDQARLTRIQCFVADCLNSLNPYQVRTNKGAGGLHASPNPSVIGLDT